MKQFDLVVNEQLFNVLWRSLNERDSELESALHQAGEGSDEAALVGNDLVYLRLVMQQLKDKATANGFSEGVFSTEDGYIDLSDL